ncbi:MAG: cell surface protein SprA [Bacteroidota bacterium]
MSKISIAALCWVITSFFLPGGEEDPSMHKAEVTRSAEIEMYDSLYWDEDTSKKKNPNNRVGDATQQGYVTPIFLGNPKNMQTIFELNDSATAFSIYERVGKVDIRYPSQISLEDYLEYRREKANREFFKQQSLASNEESELGLKLDINIDELSDVFGGGTISIRPTGYATLDFSIDNNVTENPAVPLNNQSNTIFNFDQTIQMGIIGQIGEKLRLNANFDTQATFDFQNELKLKHTGTEDQILQEIEAGNVSMQLGNSLIQGRQNLFGLRTKLRLGPVYLSLVASTERGQVETIDIKGGGAIETPFDVEASDYDMNRHFFLSHYFRSRYEDWLQDLPVMRSTLRINRVEVWVEQQGATQNTRNAVGFIDLGENATPVGGGQGNIYNDNIPIGSIAYPDNDANDLHDLLLANPNAREQNSAKGAIEALNLDMINTEDFQVLGNMRRLNPNEYRVNTQLGYISLNAAVPTNQVLFVAFDYSLDGQTYQVGEFSNDVPANGASSNVLFLKMLKSSVIRVNSPPRPYPAWDLMMKNVYNVGYGLKPDNFFLDVRYESGTSAGRINFLPSGKPANKPLIQVLNLDKVTNNTAPGPDNFFDYIEGVTVVSDRGLVIFPVLEPFGSHLARQLDNDPNEVAKYVYDPLYDDTQAGAKQNFPELNRFTLEGYYRSSGGSEIQLNTFNLSEGSITVRAGGRVLQEGVDYQVDYFGGKVSIINPSILTSGQDIQVSFESSSLYQLQTKTLLGARAEYAPSDKLSLGLTALNLREQPFNQKLTLGDEPINNTIWGVDASYSDQSDQLTKLIDKLPLITTKAPSSIDGAFEAAQFIPGVPRVIRNDTDRGIVYLDDFEAAATPFSLQGQQRWRIASFPENNPEMFNPADRYAGDSLADNYSRAKLAWYQIDQAFYQRFGIEFPEEDLANNYTRQVFPDELFPTASRPFGQNIQTTFDLHYLPSQRGPYNFQKDQNRLNPDGSFSRPRENWAGIMREIDVNNDFEATNVEFVEFWLMDPFMDNPGHTGGEFYLNLGLINEDVLADESLSREHGLPGPNEPGNLINTPYGIVSINNPTVNAFNAEPLDRTAQDVGLDGLPSLEEFNYFTPNFLDSLQGYLTPQAYAELASDPSSDDFLHFRNEEYETRQAGILERYLKFNGLEGNSPINETNTNYTVQATQQPDMEDINENGSLDFAEQYYEYRIDMKPSQMIPGQNFIVDSINTSVLAGNRRVPVTWFQFRVPISGGRPVNNISNFKSINFMRMYMTGFSEEIIMRMTEFQLVSSQWLRYTGNLADPGPNPAPPEPPFGSLELGSVSLEENSTKLPFNYTLPPGIVQQQINGNTAIGFFQDERSLQLRICDLKDGDARGIFKNVSHDLRQYDRLKLFMHAEAIDDGVNPPNFEEVGDARVFIRLGLDNDFNYYEYEMPLTPSDLGGSRSDPFNVWPDSNEFDFRLALLAAAKADRNSAGTGLIYRHMFVDSTMNPDHRIYIKGTPKLSDVRNIMIGVRNPKDPSGQPICIEVWANELRITNFDRQKGYAAQGNLSVRLADIGDITASGSIKTVGFGPIDQKISNRPQEDQMQYDLSANVQLDRLLPKKWGLQLPVYATLGESFVNPQFNPQEADVRTDKLIETLSREDARNKIKEIQTYRRTRSISFNNWRKIKTQQLPNRQGGSKSIGEAGKAPKSYPWDISNFDFTFAYNEQLGSDAVIERRFNTQHRAAINYRYNFPAVTVQPFKKFEKLTFLHFINFNPLPTSFSMGINGDRQFEERAMRPAAGFGGGVDPTYAKNFLLNRNYNLVWNFTRNLQFNYTANNISRVDEVRGYWETADQRERDSLGTVWENLIGIGRGVDSVGEFARVRDHLVNMGRTTNFTQNFSLSYQLPFSQIKPLDWINGTASYTGSYIWQQAPEVNKGLGNTISNTQAIQANGRLDLNGFYRKFKPLRDVLDARKNSARNQGGREMQQGRRPNPRQPQPPKQPEPTAEEDTTKKPNPILRYLKIVGREVVRIALSVKTVDLTYNSNSSTSLPGFLPQTDNFGLDWDYVNPITGQRSPVFAPTAGFVFGSQADIRGIAADNYWITQDTTLANLYLHDFRNQLTARTSIELIRGLRIEVSANRSMNENESEFFKWIPGDNDYGRFGRLSQGSFSMSYIFANTAFQPIDPNQQTLVDFSNNRSIISNRLAGLDNFNDSLNFKGIVDGGFSNGYVGTSQDVLIPALLSAYGVYDPNEIELTSFPKIPLPNWSLNYNGLTSIPSLRKHFNSISLKHSYRGTYSIGNFSNDLNFQDFNGDGYADIAQVVGEDTQGNPVESYYSQNIIQIVQIQEQFSPLIGVTMNMKNGATVQIDYKKGRQVSLNVGSLQLTEMRNEDVAVMIGYRKDKLNWTFNLGGRTINLKNSVNFQFRATIRDTYERNLYLGPTGVQALDNVQAPDITRGAFNFILSPSIDYVVNSGLNVKLFFERNVNNPHVLNAYRTSFASGGVQLRFSLAQ